MVNLFEDVCDATIPDLTLVWFRIFQAVVAGLETFAILFYLYFHRHSRYLNLFSNKYQDASVADKEAKYNDDYWKSRNEFDRTPTVSFVHSPTFSPNPSDEQRHRNTNRRLSPMPTFGGLIADNSNTNTNSNNKNKNKNKSKQKKNTSSNSDTLDTTTENTSDKYKQNNNKNDIVSEKL